MKIQNPSKFGTSLNFANDRCDSPHGVRVLNQYVWYLDKCAKFVCYQFKLCQLKS
jgi:hypothetical protein